MQGIATDRTITGFSINVDALEDGSLGGHWNTFQMGSLTLGTRDAQSSGFVQTSHRLVEKYDYGETSLSRAYAPAASAAINQWFLYAEQNGTCTVAITVHAVNALGVPEFDSWIFKDAFPKTWTLPTLEAGKVGDITETITFSHSGFYKTTNGSTNQGFSQGEKVETCKLAIVPSGGLASTGASVLAGAASWQTPGIVQRSEAVTSTVSTFPTISFFLPPAGVQFSTGGQYSTDTVASASGSGPVQWLGTQATTFSFNFILDKSSVDAASPASGTAGNGSVMPIVEQLISLCEPEGGMASSLIGVSTAPLVVLIWGEFVSPLCFVSSLNVNFTKFDTSGSPTRAEGSISLQQYPLPTLGTNPTSGGEYARRSATMIEGDSLAHTAYREYRSAARWRDLAQANEIDDPMRLPVGSAVMVPAASELPARSEKGLARSSNRTGRARHKRGSKR